MPNQSYQSTANQSDRSTASQSPASQNAPALSVSEATFADIPEFGAGHATNADALTGCTIFVARGICQDGATCGVDVRGGAPATRETDLLRPENMVQKVNAVMIGGGSAYGLEAACGAMEALAEAGFGFELAGARVPIVPAACLFDLPIGKPEWPDKAMGAAAAKAALAFDAAGDDALEQGCVGAGTGATINKAGRLEDIVKSGFGYSGLKLGELVVMSCVAVNALGMVVDEAHGDTALQMMAAAQASAAAQAATQAAGGCEAAGAVTQTATQATGCSVTAGPVTQSALVGQSPCANTTLGVILTNATLDKAQATKVSQMAQDAYARAIVPVHTTNDGDTIFTMASGKVEANIDVVGMLACATMEKAIRSAVKHAATQATGEGKARHR